MHLSTDTAALLTALDAFSQHKLTRREDLGVLLELALQSGGQSTLDDLSFTAKFVSRTYGIMKRIGTEGSGYDALEREFAGQMERAVALTRTLLETAPAEEQHRFDSTYHAKTPDALARHLALLYDLSWYKNWLIDHPTE